MGGAKSQADRSVKDEVIDGVIAVAAVAFAGVPFLRLVDAAPAQWLHAFDRLGPALGPRLVLVATVGVGVLLYLASSLVLRTLFAPNTDKWFGGSAAMTSDLRRVDDRDPSEP